MAQRKKDGSPARITTISDLLPGQRNWLTTAMLDHGWVEGQDFILVESEFQFGGANLNEAVTRAIASKPDVIFATGVAYTLAIH